MPWLLYRCTTRTMWVACWVCLHSEHHGSDFRYSTSSSSQFGGQPQKPTDAVKLTATPLHLHYCLVTVFCYADQVSQHRLDPITPLDLQCMPLTCSLTLKHPLNTLTTSSSSTLQLAATVEISLRP